MAIAAAFNNSFPAGVGIATAFCMEEFVHKINDFAMLMASGMNTHEAILFNVLSSLPVFLGIFVGEAVLHIDPICYGFDPNYNGELRPCDKPEQVLTLCLAIYYTIPTASCFEKFGKFGE